MRVNPKSNGLRGAIALSLLTFAPAAHAEGECAWIPGFCSSWICDDPTVVRYWPAVECPDDLPPLGPPPTDSCERGGGICQVVPSAPPEPVTCVAIDACCGSWYCGDPVEAVYCDAECRGTYPIPPGFACGIVDDVCLEVGTEPAPIGCDDGTALTWDIMPIVCPPGASLVVRAGSYACVDPTTCEPVPGAE